LKTEAQPHGHRNRADELSALGYKAFRSGKIERAQQLFERALALGGENGTILSDLGVAASALGNNEAARIYHERALRSRRGMLGEEHEDVASSLHNLAIVCRSLGDLDTAARCHEAGLRIWRATLGPFHPAVARGLSGLGAVASCRADLQGAAEYFAAAVRTDPGLVSARHNLAAALARLGRATEAAAHRDVALRSQSVFVQEAAPSACRVLILAGADLGNVPLEHLLPDGSVTRIWWFPAHGAPARLPPFDLVFNGIGDPDMAGPSEAAISAFLQRCGKPVLNHPARVLMTRRDRLAEALAGIEGIRIPRVHRLTGQPGGHAWRQEIADAGLAPPLLLRPPASHGGDGVMRIDDWPAVEGSAIGAAAGWYATEFVDCTALDGFVRKYRIAFVGGEPYPYHLAISPHWMVHYRSADMPDHAWKLAEEAEFLADWRAALGPAAAGAIAAVGRTLALDFCGIDFGLAPDGRAVLFEANATMLIHPEAADGPLAFKNPAVQRIVDAMQALLRRRAAK
jgi:tetratricopeptide (TPR) repeat protein